MVVDLDDFPVSVSLAKKVFNLVVSVEMDSVKNPNPVLNVQIRIRGKRPGFSTPLP
jgi:hypothetical protein